MARYRAMSKPTDYRRPESAGKATSAMAREKSKIAKYQQLMAQLGQSCTFYPMVIERDTLAIGPKSLELIEAICAHSRSHLPPAQHLSVTEVKIRLQLAVCRGTSAFIRHAFSRDHRADTRATLRVIRAATEAVLRAA